MKRTYLFGTIMAFSLAAASVGAQQDRPTPSSSDQASKTVVVTGCLKSGSQLTATGTAGTTGTSGTSAAGSSFILADAKMTPAGSGSATSTATSTTTGTATGTATTGTSGSTATADADKDKNKDKAKSFALVGGTPSELQGYINSKVEITGTIDSSASVSSTTGSSATGSTASGTASTMSGMSHGSDHPKLKVTSVRQIAANCDPAQQ